MDNLDIPVFKFDIDPEKKNNGIHAIALVSEPAIESNFKYFDADKVKTVFTALSGYQQVVHGLALRANKKILRTDKNGENPFYGVFTADVVKKLRDKFMKDQANNEVNVGHSQKAFVQAFMQESFIIDSPARLQDVQQKGISEAALGDWYVAYHIESPEVFAKVVSGELNGFSIEGELELYFNKIKPETQLQSMTNQLFKITESFQKIVDDFKKLNAEITPAIQKFDVAQVKDSAEQVEYTVAGSPVSVVAPDGSKQLAVKGDIVLSDGQVLSVNELGNLIAINPAPAAPASDAPALAAPVASGSTEQSVAPALAAPVASGSTEQSIAPALAQVAKFEAQVIAKDQTIIALNAQVIALQSEKLAITSNLENVKAELLAFKKQPLTEPVLSTSDKKVEFSKEQVHNMSTLERIAMRSGVQLSSAVLKSKMNKK